MMSFVFITKTNHSIYKRCSQDEVESGDIVTDLKTGSSTTTPLEEFAEGEVFAFEEGGVGFGGDPIGDSMSQDLEFDLECQEFGPIYVPSSYDDMLELWVDLSKCSSGSNKNRSEGNISQVIYQKKIGRHFPLKYARILNTYTPQKRLFKL